MSRNQIMIKHLNLIIWLFDLNIFFKAILWVNCWQNIIWSYIRFDFKESRSLNSYLKLVSELKRLWLLDNSWNRNYVAPDRKETNIYQNFGHKFCLLSHTLHALERNKNPCVLGNLRRKLTICLHEHQDIIFANWRGSSSLTLETINEEVSNLWISQNCQPYLSTN